MQNLVIDLETRKDFSDVGGRKNFAELEVAVVGVYDYAVDQYRSYAAEELSLLEERILAGGTLIGFNIREFDFIVLQPYLKRVALAQTPALDIMKELQEMIGRRVSLESVAAGTFGPEQRKSGSGENATKLWKAGRVAELTAYCLQDVALTKAMYEYGRDKGEIFFQGWQRRYAVPVKWK